LSSSDIIALIAAVIAALALFNNWRTGRQTNDLFKRQVDLQHRLTQIEQSREYARIIQSLKAELRAELRSVDRGSYRLFIKNTGQGTARNVKVILDGKPVLEHPAIPRGEQEARLIGPGSEISYLMAISFDCHPPFELSITWDDESGDTGKYSTSLTF